MWFKMVIQSRLQLFIPPFYLFFFFDEAPTIYIPVNPTLMESEHPINIMWGIYDELLVSGQFCFQFNPVLMELVWIVLCSGWPSATRGILLSRAMDFISVGGRRMPMHSGELLGGERRGRAPVSGWQCGHWIKDEHLGIKRVPTPQVFPHKLPASASANAWLSCLKKAAGRGC